MIVLHHRAMVVLAVALVLVASTFGNAEATGFVVRSFQWWSLDDHELESRVTDVYGLNDAGQMILNVSVSSVPDYSFGEIGTLSGEFLDSRDIPCCPVDPDFDVVRVVPTAINNHGHVVG